MTQIMIQKKIFIFMIVLLFCSCKQSFNFQTGDAVNDVAIAAAIPIIISDVSPKVSDATLIFDLTLITNLALFDAIAPYHPTAIGIYTQHTHRLSDKTNKNKNIACLYASYHIFMSLFPKRKSVWDAMMNDVGLDPKIQSQDVYTPEGLGFLAAKNVILKRMGDGANRYGDSLKKYYPKKYHRNPYSDTTGYIPKNTAYELTHPSNWQPAIVTQGNGIFRVQQFVTPQFGQITPLSIREPSVFQSPTPKKSDINNWGEYYKQAKILVNASANLDTEKKIKSEFFDHKFRSLGRPPYFLSQNRNLTLQQYVHFDLLAQLAVYDTGIIVWRDKRKYDAVRPFSAIAHIWGSQIITAWGGPGMGKVYDMPANQWRSYISVSDHPEYPSGSASFCAATATAIRNYFNGDDRLNFKVTVPKGQSVVEPGITPPEDTEIEFKTWTDFVNDCGQSRIWGGVHFPDAVEAGRTIGDKVGNCAYRFVQAHIEGKLVPSVDSSNCKY